MNIIKKWIFECERQLLESDNLIKLKFSEIVELLILKDIINDWKAEQMLWIPVDKIEKELEVVQSLDISESLDLDLSNMTTNQLWKEIDQLRNVVKQNEKKIEDYERVAMLAPECKNEI